MMKETNSLHIDTNSWNLKVDRKIFGVGTVKRRVSPLWSQDTKISCISRRK